MRKLIGLSILVMSLSVFFACDESSKREKMGAAGSGDELRDSTRLDSSVDARNRAGGKPASTHDTI